MAYTYTLTSGTSILRSDGAIIPAIASVSAQGNEGEARYIPAVAGNADYDAYLAWVTEGNTPAPYTDAGIPLAVQAQERLDRTDITVLRCVSASVAVPADWQAYRVALRNIATGKDTTSTTLPPAPQEYPAGT